MSDSLWPHGLQLARLPCPSPTTRVYSDSSINLVMTSNHLILCHPFLLLPSIFPNIRVFSKESVLCITWPKYWSFSFSISPSNELSGLISFKIDWFDLLAVQGTLQSLFQQHSSKVKPLITSVQFSPSVVCSSLQPHGLQHSRLPCLSSTLRTCSNSGPWSWWCHPTISAVWFQSPHNSYSLRCLQYSSTSAFQSSHIESLLTTR